jgi:hypothetical protein
MAKGNPDGYDFNSHTSIASYNKIYGRKEDEWNKWEYDPVSHTLKTDTMNTLDDSDAVQKRCEKFFKKIDCMYIRNLYNRNTGNSNTGNWNTGNSNTGNSNTGNSNTGDSNTGNSNTGHSNTGNWNTGYWNTGYSNTGHSNTGNWNTGYSNTGHRNTGNSNTGNWNTGHSNTGNSNTGNWNTGLFNTNEPNARLFNKQCKHTLSYLYERDMIPYIELPLVEFISGAAMTDEEKLNNPNYNTIGGYLRVLGYKEAWSKFWEKVTDGTKEKIKAIPNFNRSIFEEITGIDFKENEDDK